MNDRSWMILIAGFFGLVTTLIFYLALLFFQNENADFACENPAAAVPGIKLEDIRDIGFENSYLNLGGRCEYRLDDGSVVVTREPGWWFSGMIACFVALLALVAGWMAMRKGHVAVLFGLTALLAPPLGLALAVAVPRRGSPQGRDAL